MAKGIKLTEAEGDISPDAKVIDATFTVVKAPRARRRGGGFFTRVLTYLLIVVVVAVVGFLIPPLWLTIEALLQK